LDFDIINIDYDNSFNNIFQIFLNKNKYADMNIFNYYNLDYNSNINKLVLINYCKLILKLNRLSLKYLFDESKIYIINFYDDYKLNFHVDFIFYSFYINIEKDVSLECKAYDYLNLMVSDSLLIYNYKKINDVYCWL